MQKETIRPTPIALDMYREMFAGRIPNHNQDPYQSIVLWASDVLKTDHVHVGMKVAGAWAYYFAAPSKTFSSTLEFATPLAAAIPGHPAHQGEGAYLLTQGEMSVAVIYANEQFSLLCNDTNRINGKLLDMEVPVYLIDDTVSNPLRIESTRGRYRRLADRFSQKTIKYATVISATSFIVAIVASFAETALSTSLKSESEKTAEELNLLVKKIEYASPLSHQIGQVSRLSATVVRAGGWINEYHLKAGKETFVVTMPDWVTQDYIAALGPGAVAEYDKVNNQIKVTKE